MIKVRVYINLKSDVLDNQGMAIEKAINRDENYQVCDVRQGKIIDLVINAADAADAEQKVHKLCEDFLANTVIEEYEVKILQQ